MHSTQKRSRFHAIKLNEILLQAAVSQTDGYSNVREKEPQEQQIAAFEVVQNIPFNNFNFHLVLVCSTQKVESLSTTTIQFVKCLNDNYNNNHRFQV